MFAVPRAIAQRIAGQHPAVSRAAAPALFCRCFATHKGQCHCGEVHFEVEGKPDWSAICHCSICRRTHSAPYAELCGYKPDNVKVTQGAESLSMYNVHGKSKEDRYFCKVCGSKVYSMLNHLGCKAVHLQNLTSPNHGADGKLHDDFKPSCHIFYASGTITNLDALPKFETLPEAFGGDGKQLPNDFHDTR
mmetsp:Transcript_99374/g.318889  ORF Transcript_99374/g.318889 Transcript_99374/m.318889 type:complete len:191 (-) Transcript_99374:189-761(-)